MANVQLSVFFSKRISRECASIPRALSSLSSSLWQFPSDKVSRVVLRVSLTNHYRRAFPDLTSFGDSLSTRCCWTLVLLHITHYNSPLLFILKIRQALTEINSNQQKIRVIWAYPHFAWHHSLVFVRFLSSGGIRLIAMRETSHDDCRRRRKKRRRSRKDIAWSVHKGQVAS